MQTSLEQDLKQLIINTLDLEDITPDDIAADAPLFGEGLGLDSVDALELGLALQKHYGIAIDPHAQNMREHFSNINTLSAFVRSQQGATKR